MSLIKYCFVFEACIVRSEREGHPAAADGNTIKEVMIVLFRISQLLGQVHFRLSLPNSLSFKLSFLGMHLRETSAFLRKQHTHLVLLNGPGME